MDENSYFQYLISDLNQQTNQGVEANKRMLNIGVPDGKNTIEMRFDFNLSKFFSLLNTERDENGKYICPYIINCNKVIFNYIGNFEDVNFKNIVEFKETKFKSVANFQNTCFENDVTFSKACFEGQANFKNANFFNKTNDLALASFYGTTFKYFATFDFVVFQTGAKFSNTTFQGEVSFQDIELEDTLLFDNIELGDKSSISFKRINYTLASEDNALESEFTKPHEKSEIKIINTSINTRINFNNVCIEKISLKGSSVIDNGILNRINFEADCANWETATFFKHEELKRDNIIKALEYKAIEKNLYRDFVKDMRKKITGEIKKFKQAIKKNDNSENIKDYKKETKSEIKKIKKEKNTYWWEARSICLSRLSNNHGQHWGKAVGFTLLSGLIFFLISYLPNIIMFCLNPETGQTLADFGYSFGRYFIPVDYSGIITNAVSGTRNVIIIKSWLILPYFLGKIAISYGIVEIVQAFRKLK